MQSNFGCRQQETRMKICFVCIQDDAVDASKQQFIVDQFMKEYWQQLWRNERVDRQANHVNALE
jgi:hypothetical protein